VGQGPAGTVTPQPVPGAEPDRPGTTVTGVVGVSTTVVVGSGGGPVFSLDHARPVPGGMHFEGWVLDPDSSASTQVRVAVDAVDSVFRADIERPDVAVAHPGAGAAHGFSFDLAVPDDAGRLCLTAVNIGPGGDTAMQCFASPRGRSFGMAPVVVRSGSVLRLSGWVFDTDTVAPMTVSVVVNGVATDLIADRSNVGNGNRWPGYGADHGYEGEVVLPADLVSLCFRLGNVAGTAGRDVESCVDLSDPGSAALPQAAGRALAGDPETIHWH
jgi:hypothetical protein